MKRAHKNLRSGGVAFEKEKHHAKTRRRKETQSLLLVSKWKNYLGQNNFYRLEDHILIQ
jgi:hypothetical protein